LGEREREGCERQEEIGMGRTREILRRLGRERVREREGECKLRTRSLKESVSDDVGLSSREE